MSKSPAQPAPKTPSNYNYDRSNYVVLTSTVRRDASTGRIISTETTPKR